MHPPATASPINSDQLVLDARGARPSRSRGRSRRPTIHHRRLDR